MPDIFVATLGERPEAITVALDLLLERRDAIERATIVHTSPQGSRIGESFDQIQRVFHEDYPRLHLRMHEICHHNGAPLIDLVDRYTAELYHDAFVELFQEYKQEGYTIHLLVAGGRKAMSVYATLAASLVFSPSKDRVWTVLSAPDLVQQRGQFHIPKGRRDDVQLVDMPLITARLLPGMNPADVLKRRQNPRLDFLQRLTVRERAVVDELARSPYASNEELGRVLSVSHRTIENQLSSVYAKLAGFVDLGETITNKRQALLDILREG